jgi:predicted amidophosphoribosyltransferase
MSAHDMTAEIICTGCKHGYAEAALFCPNCGRPKLRETTADALVGKLLGERARDRVRASRSAPA